MKGMICCWLAPAAFLLDRVTKIWAGNALKGAPRQVWSGVLGLTYVENTGAAFGMLQGRQGLLAIITGLILLAATVWMLWRGKTLPLLAKSAIWLMIGGAAGNLYDRIVHGAVIDFIEIELFQFPVFNVADICVCVAFALLAGWILFGGEWKEHGRG